MIEEPENRPLPSLEDLFATLRRRRWWILFSIFLCWAVVWSVSWLWPASYESEGLILVEQQKVPEQFVVPNVTLDLQDRVASMTQQILSRTRLQSVIDRFHLYPPSRGLNKLLQSRDPVEQMRRDIKIDLVQSDKREGRPGGLMAFKIYYSARSPELAQQINSELTSLFIDENLKAQQQLSESTTVFLDNQLAAARAKLEEQEAMVRAFKAKHLGDLPSQLESNVQILSGLQSQLQTTQRALDGAKQQELYLESLQKQYQSVQGEDLNSALANLRSKYTDDYPDIIALKAKIARRDNLVKQIENQIGPKQETDKPSEPMMQIQSQIKANQLEIQNYEKRQKVIESQISTYQARLNLTPQTEQELAEISRGYEESKADYDSLLRKQSQSQLATSLEKRQQGEQFRILDPPSLPDKPSAPNHLLVSLGGLVLGIIVGFSLSVFMELIDVRVRRETDLEVLVPARVLVGIPHLGAPGEDRLLARNRRIEIGAVAGIVILILAGNLYAFYKG
jgi:protein tyrosine kinase modulator